MSDTFRVTKVNYPALFEAFETISHDAGARAGHEFYLIAEQLAPRLMEAEKALAALTSDDQQTIAIGEETEMLAIANRSPELKRAHEVLHEFWENHLPDPAKPRNGEQVVYALFHNIDDQPKVDVKVGTNLNEVVHSAMYYGEPTPESQAEAAHVAEALLENSSYNFEDGWLALRTGVDSAVTFLMEKLTKACQETRWTEDRWQGAKEEAEKATAELTAYKQRKYASIEALEEQIQGHEQRHQDLLEANNRYLERARTAEADAGVLSVFVREFVSEDRARQVLPVPLIKKIFGQPSD